MASQTKPRRWNTEIKGIVWLPRMIDKARMSTDGVLGSYLIGHSPVDHALMRRLNVTTTEFVQIAASHPGDDASVLADLRARPGYDETRVRRWSANFKQRYRMYLRLWDLDEGYARPTFLERIALGAYGKVEGGLSALVRKVLRAP